MRSRGRPSRCKRNWRSEAMERDKSHSRLVRIGNPGLRPAIRRAQRHGRTEKRMQRQEFPQRGAT